MKHIEEYKGIMVPIPKTIEEALIKMDVEINLYKESFEKNDFKGFANIKIWYEYDRKKAIELGANISQFPEQLNYLEAKN